MPAIETINALDFHQRVEGQQGPLLLIFTGPGCGACRHLKRVLEEDHLYLSGLRVWELDVERDHGLVEEFEVFHLPSMFLFLKGRYHCRLHSEPRAAKLREAIDSALDCPPEEAP